MSTATTRPGAWVPAYIPCPRLFAGCPQRALMPAGANLPGYTPPAASAAPPSAPAAAAPAAVPAAAAPAAVSLPPPAALQHVGCFSGHASTVFTLCFDAGAQQLVSGGHDGQLLVWSMQGQVVSRWGSGRAARVLPSIAVA